MLKLIESLYQVCDDSDVPVDWFNLGLHEDGVEIYTAEEHDDYFYHGSMGVEARNCDDVLLFVKGVKRQNEYFRNKEEK